MDTPAQKLIRLQALKNYSTCYELVMTRGDTKYLVQYTLGRSRHALLRGVRKLAESIVKVSGVKEMVFGAKASDGITVGEWTIKFSGRTERDCINEGELPFVKTVANSMESDADGCAPGRLYGYTEKHTKGK